MTGRSAVEEQLDGSLDRRRVGRRARANRRPVVIGRVDLVLVGVPRDLDEDGAETAVPDLGERSPHRVGQRRADAQLVGPLRDRAVALDRPEVLGDPHLAPVVAGRQEQDRHRVRVRLRDAAERILGARARLHREDADALTRGRPAHRVGHVDPGPLLADDDRPDADRGRSLDQRVDGVADQQLDALAGEDAGDGVGDPQTVPPRSGSVRLSTIYIPRGRFDAARGRQHTSSEAATCRRRAPRPRIP